MPLKKLSDCTRRELGHKAASLVFLAQHGVRVPDAWMWLQPRQREDIQEFAEPGAVTVILRVSEPIGSHPQGVSGLYPSQAFTPHELLGSALNSWLGLEHPVIVQRFVKAAFGGAAHVKMSEDDRLILQLSWSSDVKEIMDGSDSGMDVWLGDLPAFEGDGAPILIARAAHVPEPFSCSSIVPEFLAQMRSIARLLRVPFEVEWIVDNAGSLIFLQLIQLAEAEITLKTPWVHIDASTYANEK